MRDHRLVFPLLLLFVSILSLPAQNFQRKGSLGVYLHDLTVEERRSYPHSGVLVQQIIPETSGAAIGLQANDLIHKVNGQPVNNTAEIVRIAQAFREGDPLSVEIWRGEENISLTGKIKGKPLEKSEVAEVIYDGVPFRDGWLRSIIHKPKADGKFPLLVYLQGFDCSSIDNYYTTDAPVQQLVNDLVEQGFAVYRVEKPGVGDSQGSEVCETIGYETEIAAFDAALSQLKKYSFIDHDNIFYFGHSLGGVTAPLLAVKHQPKGVIAYGTVLKSWYEYMLNVNREQRIVRGDDFVQLENDSRRMLPLMAEFMLFGKTPQQLAENPAYRDIVSNPPFDLNNNTLFGRHASFWQELQQQNLTEAWQKAGVHTLALYGEYDIHAISPESVRLIAGIVNTYHPGKGKYEIIAGTEHGFAKVPSMQEYVQMRDNGTFDGRYMAEHYNPEIARIITDWMLGIIRMS